MGGLSEEAEEGGSPYSCVGLRPAVPYSCENGGLYVSFFCLCLAGVPRANTRCACPACPCRAAHDCCIRIQDAGLGSSSLFIRCRADARSLACMLLVCRRRWRRQSTTEECTFSRWMPQVSGRVCHWRCHWSARHGAKGCRCMSVLLYVATGRTPALNSSSTALHPVVCGCSAHPDQLPALLLPCPYPAHACAALVSPYVPSLPRSPELTSIYMTSGLDVPLESKDWGWLASEQDVAHLGGGWCGCLRLSRTGCSCCRLVV